MTPTDTNKVFSLRPIIESLSRPAITLVLTDDSAAGLATPRTAGDAIRLATETLRYMQRLSEANRDLVTAAVFAAALRTIDAEVMKVNLVPGLQ